MTTWVIVGIVVLVVVVLLARLSRPSGRLLWHDAARSEALRSLLAARGLHAEVASEASVPMPDFRLPIAWKWRSKAGSQATADDGTQWFVYDSESRGRGVVGCNSTRTSSGDTEISRHTVVALTSGRLKLPRFTVVPNVKRRLEEELPSRFREAGLGDSKMTRWATRAAFALTGLEERGTALVFEGRPEFVDAFRVTGGDEAALRLLFDQETMSLLLRHPWAIVEGHGSWLAVTRNTAAAFATRGEHDDDGLLSAESAAEVLALATGLAARWT